ncbi:MAG: 2-succinyl-5-enolpyruvyl-6-hydroxy-3-cyclohexene-1-carboxylic-acid synthase, partial [Humibacillus sp.]|nr:2-succinyl-5-enolpyruvyl-6-hydroxy-3-cyclohexene-1-carboxylic-acid synthase [Humibacillus sp.]
AGDLRLHVRVDERSAGFLALGVATGSRRPVAVVTTSGTAVGNLLPAVMEAHHSARPLIVVSADRPDRLRGSGANQTTEQAGLFGVFAACHDLAPAATPGELAAAAAAACSAPGPTQLNLQLDGDLLPIERDASRWWQRPAPAATPAEASARSTVSPDAGDGPETLTPGPRTVVVAGDDAGPAARLLAEAGNWPLFAEPTSGARIGRQALRTYRLLLGTALRARIERVVVIGHPTLSRFVTALICDPSIEVLSVRGPAGVATDPGRVARVLESVPRVTSRDGEEWFGAWRDADGQLSAIIDEAVAAQPLSPLAVAAVVGRAVAADTTLVVGSSNPVRDLDVMSAPWPAHQHRFVVGNRGLAGIDGMVSTAAGVALGRSHAARSIAFIGDLTFLHDTNGLLIGPFERRPSLTVVVLNDDGGAIFATLEQGGDRYSHAFERVFATPHGTDLKALCAAHHTAYERVTDLDRLVAALNEAPRGIRVLEVPVSRADRRAEATWLRDLAQQVVPHRRPDD